MTAMPSRSDFSTPARQCASPADFVAAMARAATGVSVVTTDGTAGRFGITVSAVSSVSAEAPMVLVCINRKSPAVAAIAVNGRFAVNMLAGHQADIARTFAGRPDRGAPYDFSAHDWSQGAAGLPCLAQAAAVFECEVDSGIDAGTHRIFIGQVVSAAAGAIDPLVYAARDFRRPMPLEQSI
jgi:flavin reductase (DIM6/NTAB) family NADH-FMN oxidoreductase RutF